MTFTLRSAVDQISLAEDDIAPPSRLLAFAEFRSVLETVASMALWPLLQLAPQGDGHPVLVLPGLMGNDSSTAILRRYLKGRGYDVHGWGLGCNLGPRPGVEEGMFNKLEMLHSENGRKVSIVGWSLGGVYARLLASTKPELVRSVITLGSPFTGTPRATNAWRIYEAVSGQSSDDPERMSLVRSTPPMPTTSIYSRSDGVVAWRCSAEKNTSQSESIEVTSSHLGLGSHPAVLYALANRLAQEEGKWKPFTNEAFSKLVYPDPTR